MTFKVWLENTQIVFAVIRNDGYIKVLINGSRYEYISPLALQQNWKDLIKHTPGKAFNLMKNHPDTIQLYPPKPIKQQYLF